MATTGQALQLAPCAPAAGLSGWAEQAYEADEHRHEGHASQHADDEVYVANDDHQDEAPRSRPRSSVVIVMAIFGLGGGGNGRAFGHRAIFGGSVLPTLAPIVKASMEPNKIAPAFSESQAKNSANASQAGAGTTGSIENLASPEEQPVMFESLKPVPLGSSPRVGAPTAPAGGQPVPNQVMPHVVAATDPPGPPNAVASQGAGHSVAADGTAGANRGHLATAPTAPAEADSTAAVTRPALGGGYAVQVTSERSESAAQDAFRALQAKYPNQLSGRQLIIRRADLGAMGIYYRALIGPFASAEKAAKLCSGLKAAGGDCIILKN